MKHSIHEMEHEAPIDKVLDELRVKIADGGAGVTILGNRLTIRWGKTLKYVHAVIIEVDDGIDGRVCPQCEEPDVYEDEGAGLWTCHHCGWTDEEPPPRE